MVADNKTYAKAFIPVTLIMAQEYTKILVEENEFRNRPNTYGN